MQMHTIDSLRKEKGIHIRKVPTVSTVHEVDVAERQTLAASAHIRLITQAIVTAAKAVAETANSFVISPIRRELRFLRARRSLMQMTDQHLNDLGISRGDIEYVVRNGRPAANS